MGEVVILSKNMDSRAAARRTTPPNKWNRYGASPSSGRGERPHSQAL